LRFYSVGEKNVLSANKNTTKPTRIDLAFYDLTAVISETKPELNDFELLL